MANVLNGEDLGNLWSSWWWSGEVKVGPYYSTDRVKFQLEQAEGGKPKLHTTHLTRPQLPALWYGEACASRIMNLKRNSLWKPATQSLANILGSVSVPCWLVSCQIRNVARDSATSGKCLRNHKSIFDFSSILPQGLSWEAEPRAMRLKSQYDLSKVSGQEHREVHKSVTPRSEPCPSATKPAEALPTALPQALI